MVLLFGDDFQLVSVSNNGAINGYVKMSVLSVWGQLIILSWESCGAKKMAHARHLTVDQYKKCYSLYRSMPNFRFFSDLGGKTAPIKFAKNEFVSMELAN